MKGEHTAKKNRPKKEIYLILNKAIRKLNFKAETGLHRNQPKDGVKKKLYRKAHGTLTLN